MIEHFISAADIGVAGILVSVGLYLMNTKDKRLEHRAEYDARGDVFISWLKRVVHNNQSDMSNMSNADVHAVAARRKLSTWPTTKKYRIGVKAKALADGIFSEMRASSTIKNPIGRVLNAPTEKEYRLFLKAVKLLKSVGHEIPESSYKRYEQM